MVSNAIKFSDPGGKIVISVVNEEDVIRVSVKDSGVGIPQNRIETLFHLSESYSTPGTQNEKGTGLGLLLCKEFVEKHGGKLWVESKEKKGTTFYFTIPVRL